MEYSGLFFDFFESKKISILGDKETGMDRAQKKAAGLFEGMEGDDDDDDDGSEDDDYEAGKSDHSADSDDSGSESDASDGSGDVGDKPKKVKKEKRDETEGGLKRKSPSSPKVKGIKAPKASKRRRRQRRIPTRPSGLRLHISSSSTKTAPRSWRRIPALSSQRWPRRAASAGRSLDADAKAVYEEKNKADKVRYEEEMKSYTAKLAASGADLDLDDDDDDLMG